MQHRTSWWRATGLVLVLVLFAMPAFAARRHRTQSVHKVSRHASRAHAARHARSHSRPQAKAGHARIARRSSRTAHFHVARARAARQVQSRAYTVHRGDTLAVVAKRLGTTPQALAHANGLHSIHRIAEGQVLRLPGHPATAKRVASRRGRLMIARAAPQGDEGAVCDNKSLVRTALAYRGVPYRWAGMTSRGMDCSGLVSRVLLAHGIRAPHNAASLYRMGSPVSYGELRPGDLVFFNTRGGGISHVGIYMGNDEFVHASSGSGRVTTSRLGEGYYRQRLVGARRLVGG